MVKHGIVLVRELLNVLYADMRVTDGASRYSVGHQWSIIYLKCNDVLPKYAFKGQYNIHVAYHIVNTANNDVLTEMTVEGKFTQKSLNIQALKYSTLP